MKRFAIAAAVLVLLGSATANAEPDTSPKNDEKLIEGTWVDEQSKEQWTFDGRKLTINDDTDGEGTCIFHIEHRAENSPNSN